MSEHWSKEDISKLCDLINAGKVPREVAQEMGRGEKSVRSQVSRQREKGALPSWVNPQIKPMPRLARIMMLAGASDRSVAQKTGASRTTVARWRKEVGVKSIRPTTEPRPMPEDFPQLASRMYRTDMMTRWSAADATIGRWLAEAGVEPRRKVYASAQRSPSIMVQADASLSGRAVTFLQRWGPVCRASIFGPRVTASLPDKGKQHFSLWGRIVHESELIAKAVAKGFDADEWQRVG